MISDIEKLASHYGHKFTGLTLLPERDREFVHRILSKSVVHDEVLNKRFTREQVAAEVKSATARLEKDGFEFTD